MDDPLKYYGADIAGFVLTLISLHMLGNRQRNGFLIGAVSSIAWGAFSIMAESTPTLIANIVFCAMQLRGFSKWTPGPSV